MDALITTMGVDQINMDAKKSSLILIIFGIVIGVVAIWFALSMGKKSGNNIGTKSMSKSEKPTPTKEVGFTVVRVLPSGFSPKEVTISKGMIVRFTNPTDTKVLIKWEGAFQYSKGLVYDGQDTATTVFDKEGTYTYTDDENHQGKIMVK